MPGGTLRVAKTTIGGNLENGGTVQMNSEGGKPGNVLTVNGNYKMNGQTVGREGARNLGEVRTGVEAKVNNNLSLWGNVGVQLGDKGYSDTQGMLGVKYSW
ncbi:autotransporter outer membrane beta-barrel domain-containing protein [Escherichia coli]|nr:autotransporter outer membrane beta-barrel domain-containing protein [Escherichia coli]